jgi:hypothetical protein
MGRGAPVGVPVTRTIRTEHARRRDRVHFTVSRRASRTRAHAEGRRRMARHVIERTFTEGLDLPATAERNGLPIDRITEVRVLDPYFHH